MHGTWSIYLVMVMHEEERREKIRLLIEDYILGREEMTNLFVLIDSRHEPQQIDLEFMEWLGENGIPFAIVFTKADKLGSGRLNQNIINYKELLKAGRNFLQSL